MFSSQLEQTNYIFNPLEEIEIFLLGTNWQNERISSNELLVSIKGNHCEYHITVHWNEDQQILHFAFAFNVGLSKEQLSQTRELSILRLITMLNESMGIGHYDLWKEENSIVWRYGQFITEELSTQELYSRIFNTATGTCERHYSAFQFVLWAGQSPYEAVQNIFFETVGEA